MEVFLLPSVPGLIAADNFRLYQPRKGTRGIYVADFTNEPLSLHLEA